MGLILLDAPAIEPLTVAELARHLRLDDPQQEPPPATAPSVALAGAGAGLVTEGAHRIAVSFVDADDGETPPGPLSAALTVSDQDADGQIAVSEIPLGGSRIAARKIWMTAAGGTTLLLAATLANNTATTATVNLADGSLGTSAPSVNTTADGTLPDLIEATRSRVEDVTGRQLIEATWRWTRRGWPACEAFLELPLPPLIDVYGIRYRDPSGDWQVWAKTNYVVSAPGGPRAPAGRISLASGASWPVVLDEAEAIRIDFTCGYGCARADVPAPIRQAMKLMAGTWYEQRENDVFEKNTTALPRMSLTAERLLRPYWWRPETRQVA